MPGTLKVAAEYQHRASFLRARDAGALPLAARKFRLRRLELSQAGFPLSLQASRDQSILGIDRAVTVLGTLRLVLLAFNFAAELRNDRVVIGFQLLGRPLAQLRARDR